MNVLDKVIELTALQYDVDVSAVTPETHFFDDFLDSMDSVELYMACEEAFDIEISDEDAERENLVTVGRLAAYIERRLP
jgi:acyl carrier protein